MINRTLGQALNLTFRQCYLLIDGIKNQRLALDSATIERHY
jgi:hypothetical protein